MAIDRLSSQGVLQVSSPGDNRPHWVTVAQDNQNFWSGLDAAVYFDDLYIAEIVSLQYEVQEAVYPLFSYASRTMRRAMHGSRRVFGQFTVNFQQAALFWLILEHIRATENGLTPSLRDPSLTGFGVDPKKTIKINPVGPDFSAQTLLARGVLQPPAATQFSQIVVAPATSAGPKKRLMDASQSIDKGNVASISANAERVRNQFGWGAVPSAPAGKSLLAAVRASLTTQAFQSLFDTPNGFTIHVRFGDQNTLDYLSTNSDNGDVSTRPQAYDASYLAALETLGDADVDQVVSRMPPYTTESVTGIEVTGFGKVIDDSGRPVLQTYSFLASDVVPNSP